MFSCVKSIYTSKSGINIIQNITLCLDYFTYSSQLPSATFYFRFFLPQIAFYVRQFYIDLHSTFIIDTLFHGLPSVFLQLNILSLVTLSIFFDTRRKPGLLKCQAFVSIGALSRHQEFLIFKYFLFSVVFSIVTGIAIAVSGEEGRPLLRSILNTI